MKIENKKFVYDKYPYFIADIAANHDGDLSRAKDLIWLAKEAGANCAKFQHFLADKIVNDIEFKKMDIQTHQSNWKETVSSVYKKYHFRRDWTHIVAEECLKADIDFSTTPYDKDAINDTKDLIPFIKIGSGDISWTEHIIECAKTNLPIIIATGASTIEDVDRAVKILIENGNQICVMQCNTNYTIDDDKVKYVNLRVLEEYRKRYPGVILGLSDHTLSPTSVLGSLILDVKIIEKHFTDDNSREGPDHEFAVNPKNWRYMVDASRELIDELGDGIKKIEKNEVNSFRVQRRCCTMKRDLSKDSSINSDDIEMLRPCPEGSIHPYDKDKILGKKLNKDLKKGDALLWKDVSLEG